MEQEPPQDPGEYHPEEEQLEWRPSVKYIGIGVLLLVLLGVEYATYCLGTERGYAQAMASGEVPETVNKAAVENLRHFMQAATSEDQALLKAVRERKTGLAWIKDPALRLEAEWTLAQALIDRGLAHEGTEMLDGLVQQAPATAVWGRRTLIVARSMASEGCVKEAFACYRSAAERFAFLGDKEGQLKAMAEMVELLAASSAGSDTALPALDALQRQASSLGAEGKELRANILAYMGRLYRAHGNHAEALKCFEEALSGVDLRKTPALASAEVCFGSALLEKGDRARAAKLLRDGVRRLGDGPADAPYLVTALRELARLEQEEGQLDRALALLYRAEGAATGRIADQSAFWICLYDQRGWINYTRGDYEQALTDFSRAVGLEGTAPAMRAQPLEGAGRCYMALGRADEAHAVLEECLALRGKCYPEDTAALGRINLLLGQACDLVGQTEKAAEAYGNAATLLSSPEQENDRLNAMLGRAYALTQMGEWQTAVEAWTELRPLVKEDADRRSEVETQLAACQRRLAPPAAAAPARRPANRR